jgi:hypothetical protein
MRFREMSVLAYMCEGAKFIYMLTYGSIKYIVTDCHIGHKHTLCTSLPAINAPFFNSYLTLH